MQILAARQTVVFWTKAFPGDAAPISGNIKWASNQPWAVVSPNPNDVTGLSTFVSFADGVPADAEFELTVSYVNADGTLASKTNTFKTVERPAIDVEDFSDISTESNAPLDGSGTGRYGGHDNWTFGGDGKDYPGSYGVGPETTHAPFVPLDPAAPDAPIPPAPDSNHGQ